MIAAITDGSGLGLGLAVTAVGLGFRHGIDWDHIAALTDITGAQATGRRSMFLATLYAGGHALVVFALGFLAIVFSADVPGWLDGVMEPVVGVTLLALAVCVLVGLARHGRDFRMRSRWMLVFAGIRRVKVWACGGAMSASKVVVIVHEHDHPLSEVHDSSPAHEHADSSLAAAALVNTAATSVATRTYDEHVHRHVHRHVATLPADPSYGGPTAFAIGAVHGVGAETPTQILLFLAAARAGGGLPGVLLLVCFLMGLVVANTVIALLATFGLLRASRHFVIYAATSLVIAVFSLVIGTLFVLGQSGVLQSFAGG